MTDAPLTVTLLGESHAVTWPDFAAREELAIAWGEAAARPASHQLRVYAAAVGLCTRLGRRAGADYGKARYDVLAYGGSVYGWLREQRAVPAEIAEAGVAVLTALTEQLFPRGEEVEAAAGNSEGVAAS